MYDTMLPMNSDDRPIKGTKYRLVPFNRMGNMSTTCGSTDRMVSVQAFRATMEVQELPPHSDFTLRVTLKDPATGVCYPISTYAFIQICREYQIVHGMLPSLQWRFIEEGGTYTILNTPHKKDEMQPNS